MTLPFSTPSNVYLEDRWQDQVDLEAEMLRRGQEIMQAKINRATEKGDLTRLRPHRTLLKDFIDPVAESIREWKVSVIGRKGGPTPVAYEYLQLLDNHKAAFIALKAVFRRLGADTRTVLPIAHEIGTSIEHEVNMEAWIADDPGGFEALRKHYLQRGSNAAHIRRASVSVFNKHIAERVGHESWGGEVRRRVGLQLIDNIIRGTQRFRIIADRTAGNSFTSKPSAWPLVLQPDPEMLDWLKNSMDDEALHMPVYMPTVIKPKPWDGPKDGGYWTPFVKPPFFIQFKASHETQRQRAIDEYMAIDMPDVYEAINFIQDTPWRINRRVYEVAQRAWDLDLAIAGLPQQEEESIPERPEDWETNKEGYKAWKRVAGDIHTRNAKTVSQYLATRRAIGMAKRMLDEGRFYFPHMLDFRGRMYPIPSDLSPQGHDLHRGLLEFADGKPVGAEGGKWLAIQVANTFGVDKVSLQERLDWTNARRQQWIDIAKDPLTNRQWLDADDKSRWQALAAILDLVGYYEEGPEYVSYAPIRVDGTCNGIQHLSAMVKDAEGGAAVNLIEGDTPRDIYQEVADVLTEVLQADLEGSDKEKREHAELWLEMFQNSAPRSVTKRPVMILPYGGSRMAYMKYTHEWLNKHDPVGVIIPNEKRAAAVGYLMSRLWDAVNDRLTKPKGVMDWLKACSMIASKSGLPLYWVTPSGFVVRHFYGEMEERIIVTKMDGQRIGLRAKIPTTTLDVSAQSQGIAPNFVHSMDASAMVTCTLMAKDNGITCMTTIHDSYGTHAADMWKLYSCIREGFIETYSEDVLENFLDACKSLSPETKDWPEKPQYGSLDLSQVRFSDYFFA